MGKINNSKSKTDQNGALGQCARCGAKFFASEAILKKISFLTQPVCPKCGAPNFKYLKLANYADETFIKRYKASLK